MVFQLTQFVVAASRPQHFKHRPVHDCKILLTLECGNSSAASEKRKTQNRGRIHSNLPREKKRECCGTMVAAGELCLRWCAILGRNKHNVFDALQLSCRVCSCFSRFDFSPARPSSFILQCLLINPLFFNLCPSEHQKKPTWWKFAKCQHHFSRLFLTFAKQIHLQVHVTVFFLLLRST